MDFTVHCGHHQGCCIVQNLLFTVYVLKVPILYGLKVLFSVTIIKVAVLYRFPCPLFTSPRSPILYGLKSSLWPSSRSLYCINFTVHRLCPQSPHFVWTLLFSVTIIKVAVLYKFHCSLFTSPRSPFCMDFTLHCDHHQDLKKLRHYKISDETLLWFSSYLLNRKQKVVINNIESTTENIVCGVPQGTILGPLLFLMFINDLPLYTDNVFTDLYADDTTIYQISNSQHFIEQDLQMALQKLSVWCKLNGMLLNTEKTKVMLITTSQKRLHLHNSILNLTFNNDSLKKYW